MAQVREGMRARRVSLGLTQEQVAERLGVSVNAYRDWELGKAMPLPGRRPAMGRVLEVDKEIVDAWLDSPQDDDGPPVAVVPEGVTVPPSLEFYASLEQGASRLWAYEPLVMPGLLQTRAYATNVYELDPRKSDDATLTEFVEMRMARQEALTRVDNPLNLSVVMNQAVLLMIAGNRAVMSDQLRRLLRSAAEPNTEVRVIPFENSVFLGSFGFSLLTTSAQSTTANVAVLEDLAGARLVIRRDDVSSYTRTAEYIGSRALSADESVELIRATLKERYT